MDEVPEVRPSVQLLSQCNRSLDGLRKTPVALDVVEIDGLFDPGDVEIRKPPGGLDRLGQAPSAVRVGHEADIRTKGPAHLLHAPQVFTRAPAADLPLD